VVGGLTTFLQILLLHVRQKAVPEPVWTI